MTKYRVMGIDECGSEFFVADNLAVTVAYKMADEARERFEEARSIFVEEMIDYRAEAMARYDNDEMDLY
jgi:hypothetical protein